MHPKLQDRGQAELRITCDTNLKVMKIKLKKKIKKLFLSIKIATKAKKKLWNKMPAPLETLQRALRML